MRIRLLEVPRSEAVVWTCFEGIEDLRMELIHLHQDPVLGYFCRTAEMAWNRVSARIFLSTGDTDVRILDVPQGGGTVSVFGKHPGESETWSEAGLPLDVAGASADNPRESVLS